ncbi:tyrosine-type recombinase/integrase [Komagataeibacter oboediens]|uniref:tyrosine-type recombinase/integrase n=1 Tax=Komagataeibacter oboediens TaxID=65958 RepID=UPI0023DCE77A|nr:tyrosine-type recombinase/integrase [Komagataeibacter oboediens]WEQ51165.1 tyrosine-type recombinase/integrase [Komagataeibacter oboediens]
MKKVGESEPRQPAQGTLAHIIRLYQGSVEFHSTKPKTQSVRSLYLRELETISALPIQDVKRRNILTIRDMLATIRGNGAANGFLAASRSLFSWAISRDWIEINPAAGVKPMPVSPLPSWTPEIVQRAMKTLNPTLQRAVILALFTGQRRGDLCRMKWSDISDGIIHVTQRKTSTALRIPVHATLQAYLNEWPRNNEFILTTSRGLPCRPDTLSGGLYEAAEEGKIPKGFNIHGLRKMAATLLAEAGCSTHEIASITGHKSLAMVQHYTASANQERLAKEAMSRINASFLNEKETG